VGSEDALIAQEAERVLGKNEVSSSSLLEGSTKKYAGTGTRRTKFRENLRRR